MPNSICLLNSWEAADFEKNGIVPTCRNHKHIKKLEAMELTARGDHLRDSASAKWIGPRMITMVVQPKWVLRQSGYPGPLVLQLE